MKSTYVLPDDTGPRKGGTLGPCLARTCKDMGMAGEKQEGQVDSPTTLNMPLS